MNKILNDVKITMLLLMDDLLNLVAPHICKGCGQLGSTYCQRCIFNTLEQSRPICLYCGTACKYNNLCPECARKHKLFNQLICVGLRQGSLQRLVGDYKYNSEVASCRQIAELLQRRVAEATNMAPLPDDTTIVPIPTISAHVRQRGFDHTLLVARRLATLTSWSVNNKLLIRTDNVAQHTQRGSALHEAARQSLALRPGLTRSHAHTKMPSTVLVLDDIWTTGSTMEAAGRLLRQLGVQQLVGLVVARQPH